MLKRVQHDTRGQAGSIRGLRACGHAAFTMAEILLSLTIIGVVAAITLPSLTGNINERTWNTQRKALYARFSQAIALMPSLNGYGTLTEDESGSVTEDTAAETFVTDGLAKVLKINNICDSDHLADCGLPSKITTLNGSNMAFPTTFKELNPANTSVSAANFSNDGTILGYYNYSKTNVKAAAFETQNGESIAVYYNPVCVSDMNENSTIQIQTKVCANFVYDLNGNKGPNTVGKDIGVMSVLYPTDSVVVAPFPAIQLAGNGFGSTGISQFDASKYCRKQGDEYRLPNKEESMALFTNNLLLGQYSLTAWTASRTGENYFWYVRYEKGTLHVHNSENNGTANVICIQR